ncbi:MAG TPA: hypothetical protein PK264_19570 [Hyphomicrobiaceae bacterium]|nr:hypothetical protein [Hyphomicrobiaceae bacterium]
MGKNYGFKLDGTPALALLAVIAAYFLVGRITGGTVWDRILGIRRPQPR